MIFLGVVEEIFNGKITTVTGTLKRAGTSTSPMIALDDTTFTVPNCEAWTAMKSLYAGQHRGYQLSILTRLLSIEPLTKDTDS